MRKRRPYSSGGGRRKPATKRPAKASPMLRGVRGLAWFTEEQWPRLLEVADDGASLAKDHATWLAQAEQDFQSLKGIGVSIRKVLVDVDELSDWCRRKGRKVNADSRPEFVAEALRTGRARFL